MLDLVNQLYSNNKLVGYTLTDRKENIQVTVEQFNELAKHGIIYHVAYVERTDIILAVNGLNLSELNIQEITEENKGLFVIDHKVVRYRFNKLIEMLNHKYLDYLQKKYYTNELIKLTNPNIKKSIRILELLTNNRGDETCTDIQQFIDIYNDKYSVLGYCIKNTSRQTIYIKESSNKPTRTLFPNECTYINNKELDYLCEQYNVNKGKLFNKVNELLLSIERLDKNKLLEQLSYKDRHRFIKNKNYISFKDNLEKEILRENDYNEITCYKIKQQLQ